MHQDADDLFRLKIHNKEIPCDTVIIAIGQTPNPLIKMSTPGIETYDFGGIKVNEETMETNMPLIYAGGDAVTGAATVIKAMGAGKVASKENIKTVHSKKLKYIQEEET